MGLRAADNDLLAFLQQHDLSAQDRDGMYSFGRPVREIGAALEKLTGVDQGEQEIYGVFLSGSSHQQQLQRQLYHRCALRWATWWEKNWKDHVTDEKYSRVNLLDDEPVVIQVIPTGPGMKIGGASNGHTMESDSDPNARREVFYDLDTGRALTLPKHLQSLSDDPNRLDKIQDWAAREGFDLMGTTYTPADSQKPCYAIRALGLTAWEIDQARWDTIANEIREDQPLQMGRPTSGLLLHFDEQKNDYDPTAVAVFLFVTRESSYGILFVGVEVLDTNVQVGVPSRGNQALNPVGFVKGRRFSLKMFEPLE
jgi:hypothetical protein